MTGQDHHVILGFGREVAGALKPPRHPRCARVVGGGGETEISEPLPEICQKLRRLWDGGLGIVRIGKPALGGGGRHELRNAARANRAHGVGAKAAFLPDQPAQEPDRESIRARRGIDDPANRLRRTNRSARAPQARRTRSEQPKPRGTTTSPLLGSPFHPRFGRNELRHLSVGAGPPPSAFSAQLATGGRSPLPLRAPGAQFTPSRMA